MENSSGQSFFSKIWQRVSSASQSRTLSLLILLLILASVPLTVFIAGQIQELRQRAEGTYIVSGKATANGTPLSGVIISVTGPVSMTQTTGADGNFSFSVPQGVYTYNISSPQGYTLNGEATGTYNVNGNVSNIELVFTRNNEPIYYVISGRATADGAPLNGVVINITGPLNGSRTTGANGQPPGEFSFAVVEGTYNYSITSPAGYTLNGEATGTYNVNGNVSNIELVFTRNTTGPTCPTSPPQNLSPIGTFGICTRQATGNIVTLNWDGPVNATAYNLRVFEGESTTPLVSQDNYAHGAYTILNVKANQMYRWSVSATANNCTPVSSSAVWFTLPLCSFSTTTPSPSPSSSPSPSPSPTPKPNCPEGPSVYCSAFTYCDSRFNPTDSYKCNIPGAPNGGTCCILNVPGITGIPPTPVCQGECKSISVWNVCVDDDSKCTGGKVCRAGTCVPPVGGPTVTINPPPPTGVKSPTPTATKTPTPPSASNSPTPSATGSISPSPTDTGKHVRLDITLALQAIGKPTKGNENPKNKERQLKIEIFDANGSTPVLTKIGTINYETSTGYFKALVDMGNIETGDYAVKMTPQKPIGYLRKIIQPGIVHIEAGTTVKIPADGNPPVFIVGDINLDNTLDIKDYNLYLSCFGNKANNPASCKDKDAVDLNDDGKIDNLKDLTDYTWLFNSFQTQYGN
ncbi:MAG: hypothetical protein M1450_03555 [Patescibacteria group bacterium]|nr:hypothetical protein [Patescibacteria group bacterium]